MIRLIVEYQCRESERLNGLQEADEATEVFVFFCTYENDAAGTHPSLYVGSVPLPGVFSSPSFKRGEHQRTVEHLKSFNGLIN